MTLVGKNRAIYSYNGKNRDGSKFQYKDFEKTNSYNTSFVGTEFIGTSFRAAKLKFCNFRNAKFVGDDFIGTNFRGSNFRNANFKDCIFVANVFDKTNLSDATFENCYAVGSSIKNAVGFNEIGITVLNNLPGQDIISEELKEEIEKLRGNDIIRRSNTLHGKKGKINTLTILILKDSFTEEQLLKSIPILPEVISTQFYTVSYLKAMLNKIIKDDII